MTLNRWAAACLLALLSATGTGADQAPVALPAPTGSNAVGTLTWHWSDSERMESNGASREIIARLWYPAIAGQAPTPYAPLRRDLFAHLSAHAFAGAPFATVRDPSPLALVCPGRGTNHRYYTSLAEDLASHGYAVLAVDSPTIGAAEFPDGRVIAASDRFRPSFELITGPYEKVDAFFEPAVKLGLADLQFAIGRLEAIVATDPGKRLDGRIDTTRIYAFGHSLGGRLCGALAASDDRVVALAAMEGVPPRPARRGGINAATLMLYSSALPEEMALPNIREVFDYRRAESSILRLEGFGHNSVTDQPLLFPEDFSYPVAPHRALALTRRIVLAFFEARRISQPFRPRRLAREPEITVIETSRRAEREP